MGELKTPDERHSPHSVPQARLLTQIPVASSSNAARFWVPAKQLVKKGAQILELLRPNGSSTGEHRGVRHGWL
jgi:hypothetical protein